MKLSISDYARLGITIIFLGLFVYLTITEKTIPDIVHDNITMLIAFYFALDRIGDVTGKYITAKKFNNETKKAEELERVT